MQKNVQNINNNKNVEPKMPYLSILGCKFEKVLSFFQQPRICHLQSFVQN